MFQLLEGKVNNLVMWASSISIRTFEYRGIFLSGFKSGVLLSFVKVGWLVTSCFKQDLQDEFSSKWPLSDIFGCSILLQQLVWHKSLWLSSVVSFIGRVFWDKLDERPHEDEYSIEPLPCKNLQPFVAEEEVVGHGTLYNSVLFSIVFRDSSFKTFACVGFAVGIPSLWTISA